MTTFIGFPQDGHAFSAAEVGQALAGFVRRDGNGVPVPGVLGRTDGLVSAVASAWQVQVHPFAYVRVVDGGIQVSGVSAAENVDITPAVGNVPAGQARIDRVVWDAVNAALAVVEGTPSSSPTAPPAGGYESLGTVRVNAADGMVIGSQVAVDAESTSLVSNESRVASGMLTKRSVPSAGIAVVQVPFPVGLFDGVPNVQATTLSGTRAASVVVDEVSASGFTIRLVNTSTITMQVGAFWRASQG